MINSPVVKRLFDFLAALAGLLLLSPLFAWIAVRIRLESRGPVFYRGLRLGRSGKMFEIFKFRTMYEISESYQGPPLVADGDWRITPFGAWLRRSKLNELPQLWNVLVGQMSLVGPRPEDPALAQAWPAEALVEVLALRPGITSPASVVYRNEPHLILELLDRAAHPIPAELRDTGVIADELLTWYASHQLPLKIRLDLMYARRRTLKLDLAILAWTIMALIHLSGGTIPVILADWLGRGAGSEGLPARSADQKM